MSTNWHDRVQNAKRVKNLATTQLTHMLMCVILCLAVTGLAYALFNLERLPLVYQGLIGSNGRTLGSASSNDRLLKLSERDPRIDHEGNKGKPCTDDQQILRPQNQFFIGALLSLCIFIDFAMCPNYSVWQIVSKTLNLVLLLPLCALVIVYSSYQILYIGAQSSNCVVPIVFKSF